MLVNYAQSSKPKISRC
jgi:hypothetical protein